MLLQFSCSNHKSIKDKISFSMVASKEARNNERFKQFGSSKIIRVASIYGANGSGKSNFIDAIAYAKHFIVNGLNNLPGKSLFQSPHKLSNVSTPSSYEFQFVSYGIRYAYGFFIKEGNVDEEYLYYFPSNRKVKIFERKGMQMSYGRKFQNAFALSEDALKTNRLFLTCAANYSRNIEVEQAFHFFSENLVFYSTSVDAPRKNNWYEYSVELMLKSSEIKEVCVEVLKNFDTGIVDIDISSDDNGAHSPQIKLSYGKFKTDLMLEESTGIKQLFQIICPILDILANEKVLVCDEIETGLHEIIAYQLIELFYVTTPDKFAQLIFTTHDTGLLDKDLFERDQIWFTQLTAERATDLYSLVELRNVRNNENFSKGYISGKYGAIPVLNNDFSNLWRKTADEQ